VINPHYTVRAERIRPSVDKHALSVAWHLVVTEHPLLRSAFQVDAGEWSIPGDGDLPVLECDVERFAEELTKPFDYGRGPVARLVFASDGSSAQVGVAVDHLVSDGWSLATIWDELREYYELISSGKAFTAREPEESFVGYLDNQRAAVDGARSSGRLARLDTYLTNGAIPALRLPDKGSRTDIRCALTKAHLHEHIDATTWAALSSAAATVGVSGPNLLLAAFHAALAAHTGSQRIGVTTTMANRLRPVDERAIGWYAGKLVVMADTAGLVGDPRGYLLAWRDSYWTALDFSDIPWAYLLSRLNPGDFGGFTSKPYATFNFQPRVVEQQSGNAWYQAMDVARVNVATGSRDAALGTFWVENERGVDVDWEYRPAFLGADDIALIWRRSVKNAEWFASVLTR
jgi:hypothetical protein